jgi:hypothetical protein
MLNITRSISRTACCAIFLGATSGSVLAEQAGFLAYVEATLSPSVDILGGCGAAFSADPQAALPNCQPVWISFGCSSELAADAERGYRMLEQAQLALANDKAVGVVFSDDRLTTEGFCVADYIYVLRNEPSQNEAIEGEVADTQALENLLRSPFKTGE